MPDYSYENAALSRGFAVVAGTDEAGRGPLCGEVVAAAVILPQGLYIEGLNDSKKLSEKKREKLYELIIENAVSYGIASASVEEIDRLNILNAAQLAMRRAVAMLSPTPDLVLVDGNIARDFEMETRTVIGGDALSCSIAAASILAKVTRDRMCLKWDELYPEYGIAGHKGYATKTHVAALKELGPCPIHRRSFLSKILKDTPFEDCLKNE
ncbi:MAG: ribonuclease HII [Clostridia bacterium]|nr:ribonuclease HII [Clostridia bacterium]MBQ8911332.1 ribonuclease HII [Clostridia bacterium]MBQ9129381.1 ribonuclease HII [Clostridia bacterium]